MANLPSCESCMSSGEMATDFGLVDCPDCGGAGFLPSRSVLVDWRSRDVERALSAGRTLEAKDVQWLLAELRLARAALTEIGALAHDVEDAEAIAVRIRFTANCARGLYEATKPGGAAGNDS